MSKSQNLRFREFSGKDATYSDAVEMATIVIYAFRNSPPGTMYLAPMWRFDGDILRPVFAVSDPRKRLDALVYRASAFRDSVNMQALTWYGMIKSPNTRAWIAYDTTDNAPVGLSYWKVPDQAAPPVTIVGRVLGWLRTIEIAVWRFYMRMTRPRNSVYNPRARDAFHTAMEQFDLGPSKEKEQALVAAPDPSKVSYPRNLAYELNLFCVTRQGLGIGKQLFDYTLGKIESSMKPVVVGEKTLPPQAWIIATPEGNILYRKFGFEEVDEQFMPTGNGDEKYRFTLMRKSYPN